MSGLSSIDGCFGRALIGTLSSFCGYLYLRRTVLVQWSSLNMIRCSTRSDSLYQLDDRATISSPFQYRADFYYRAEVRTTFYAPSSRGATACSLMHLGIVLYQIRAIPSSSLNFFVQHPTLLYCVPLVASAKGERVGNLWLWLVRI